jgi:hypothetical protein
MLLQGCLVIPAPLRLPGQALKQVERNPFIDEIRQTTVLQTGRMGLDPVQTAADGCADIAAVCNGSFAGSGLEVAVD